MVTSFKMHSDAFGLRGMQRKSSAWILTSTKRSRLKTISLLNQEEGVTLDPEKVQ
jgi:hypothetical protein